MRSLRFQSTRPRGARLLAANVVRWLVCFNPRARVGRDKPSIKGLYVYYVSIHAPAWGATSRVDKHVTQVQVSIHAPAWGAT